jgi:endonuclease-3 related protein
VLVQRTAWRNAERALAALRQHDLFDPVALTRVTPETLASYVRPAGFANAKVTYLHALASFFAGHGGAEALGRNGTQQLRERLLAIRGIGPETADAILLYGFQRPVWIADAYAGRLFLRLWDFRLDGAQQKALLSEWAQAERTEDLQELHALVVAHGKHRCRAKPLCDGCPLASGCRYGGAAKAADR